MDKLDHLTDKEIAAMRMIILQWEKYQMRDSERPGSSWAMEQLAVADAEWTDFVRRLQSLHPAPAWPLNDPSAMASITRGMEQAEAGQTVYRGSFARAGTVGPRCAECGEWCESCQSGKNRIDTLPQAGTGAPGVREARQVLEKAINSVSVADIEQEFKARRLLWITGDKRAAFDEGAAVGLTLAIRAVKAQKGGS